MYEVELKFPLDDLRPIVGRLTAWGAQAREPVDQCDVYFRHPVRDFAATDEALRIRTEGQSACVTYKGPVVDARTKTRREIELPLAEGADAGPRLAEMLDCLGFRPVRRVLKRRVPWNLTWQDRPFEIAFDDVAGLGMFVEIETLASEAERSAARDAILALALELGLSHPERKSYLALLLAQDSKK